MAISSIKDNLSPSQELLGQIDDDISARSEWKDEWRALEQIRLGRRPKSGIYPGAPNWIDPIVDVNVARVTEIEHTSLFTPRYLAHFIPHSPEGVQFKRVLEMAFDHLLKITLRVGTTLNTLLDEKNQGGMSVAKQVMDFESYGRVFGQDVAIPTFVHMHPLNVIVPPDTQHMQDAVRITDVHQYQLNTFRKVAKQRRWKNAEKLIEALGHTDQENGSETRDDEDFYRSKLVLIEQEIHIATVAVYESYFLDDKGRKQVLIFSPDHPEIILDKFPHVWTLGPREGQDKRWKHDQFRYEDRNDYYQDTRGISHLLKDNQQAASQFLNIKGTHYDMASYPMFENDGSAVNVNKLRPGPGVILPKGIKFAQFPRIDPTFNNDADIERARAAQRVGSTIGSEGSVSRGRDRKTATEVNSEQQNSSLMSAGSLMRFTRPLSSIYSNMWEELQANPVALPIVSLETGEIEGFIDPEVFKLPFTIISSANSRNSDPAFMNSQLGPLLQLLQNFPEINSGPIVKRFLSNIDPQLADEAVGQEGQSQLTQQVGLLTDGIKQLAQENEQIAERLSVVMEMAEINILTDKEQDEDIQRLEKAKTEVTQLVKEAVEKALPKEPKK